VSQLKTQTQSIILVSENIRLRDTYSQHIAFMSDFIVEKCSTISQLDQQTDSGHLLIVCLEAKNSEVIQQFQEKISSLSQGQFYKALGIIIEIDTIAEIPSLQVDNIISPDFGFYLKLTETQINASSLTLLLKGYGVLDPNIPLDLTKMTSSFREETSALQNQSQALSPREWEIIDCLIEGKTNKEIAYDLDITLRTVKFHVSSILEKTSTQSRTEAVVWALKQGRGAI
jgi:DNA-binding CsgD family transcriptional regulator